MENNGVSFNKHKLYHKKAVVYSWTKTKDYQQKTTDKRLPTKVDSLL